MDFVESPIEGTTALTDLILAVLSIGAAVHLFGFRKVDRWKASVWAFAFGSLGVASALGAVAHGIELSDAAHRVAWLVLNGALGLSIALLVVGAVLERWDASAARRVLPVMVGLAAAFVVMTELIAGSFLVFIIYEAAAMLVALGLYARSAWPDRRPGSRRMVAGLVVTLVAAVVQTRRGIEIELIWTFDHNGVFHLLQMVGLGLLVAGVRASMVRRTRGGA